jgi:hypothetical protein
MSSEEAEVPTAGDPSLRAAFCLLAWLSKIPGCRYPLKETRRRNRKHIHK